MERGAVKKHKVEYATWQRMKNRCYNSKHEGYGRYGGRGITVCERWRTSFANFLADMGPRPSSNHSIDRTNNNGNYDPANCRWATLVEQCNNTRDNHKLTFNGKTQGVSEWAREIGCKPHTITMRLARGWPLQLALSIGRNPSVGASRKLTNTLRRRGQLKTISVKGDNRRAPHVVYEGFKQPFV